MSISAESSAIATPGDAAGACKDGSRRAAKSKVRRIPIDAIKVDQAIQQRVDGTCEEVVAEYAQAMRDGAVFPPPAVFKDGGGSYHLADGFHRIEAYRQAHPEASEIECEVHLGDQDEALLFACGANAGLRRSSSDQRKAVTTLLSSEKWKPWANREIARRCNVSPTLVAKVRKEVSANGFIDGCRQADELTDGNPPPLQQDRAETAIAQDRRRIATRGGKQYTMKTGGIGAGRATTHKQAPPKVPLTSLARSDATEAERRKFVDGVGVDPIVDTLRVMPGVDLLNRAWKTAGQAERRVFANQHHEDINALANGLAEGGMTLCPQAAHNSTVTM
jgi:hypothetical protein